MKYRWILGLIICCLFSILTGCDKFYSLFGPKTVKPPKTAVSLPAVKGTIIARVNNIPITLEQLNKYVDSFNKNLDSRDDLNAEEKKSRKIDTREKKIEYLNSSLIRQVVFYQAALDRRLDQKEEIIEILQNDKIAVLAAEMVNETIKNIDVSSAEIEKAYNENQQLFKEPEQRKVSEIVTQTEQEAKQALMELLPGTIDFVSLAKTRSIAKSKENGGDLGYIKKGQRGAQYTSFDDVAFSAALQRGAVSGVFKVPQGYCIIRVEDIKEGKQASKTEAWDAIKEFMLIGKQEEELKKADSKYREDYKIESYEGEIK
ncbi:MAG: peptidyl-prolyl cis-trans isomerase [Candidatus Omnitrophota bacterium]